MSPARKLYVSSDTRGSRDIRQSSNLPRHFWSKVRRKALPQADVYQPAAGARGVSVELSSVVRATRHEELGDPGRPATRALRTDSPNGLA